MLQKMHLLLVCLVLAPAIVPGLAATPKQVPLQDQPNYDPDSYSDPSYTNTHPTTAHPTTSHKSTSTTGSHDPNGNAMHSTGSSAGTAGGLEVPNPSRDRVPIFTILLMTVFMSAMAGLGAVPFFFCGKLKNSWAGLANAVACGVMLAASFDLLHEGAPYSPTLTIAGMVMGAIFIKTSQEWLSQFEDASFQELSGADARKAMLIVGVMAAHAFGEGSGVGVSFSGNRGWAQGTLVTIAIGLHNIPEGMAVATVMVSKGAPAKTALFWSLFCAMPQALVAVPSYMFVEAFQSLLPLALGFAAGCMIWIVAAELMPDALEQAPHPQVATAATLSAAWLQGLSMMIATLEKPDGALSWPVKADTATLFRVTACLLPALAVQVATAAVASGLLPSLPAALGATTGVMVALGMSCLGWLLAVGELHMLQTLMWAAVGALGAIMLWRNVLRPGEPQLEVRRSLDGQLSAAAMQHMDAPPLKPHLSHPMDHPSDHHNHHPLDSHALVMSRSGGGGAGGGNGAYIRGAVAGAGGGVGTAAVQVTTGQKAAGWLQDVAPPVAVANGHVPGAGAGPGRVNEWLLGTACPGAGGLHGGPVFQQQHQQNGHNGLPQQQHQQQPNGGYAVGQPNGMEAYGPGFPWAHANGAAHGLANGGTQQQHQPPHGAGYGHENGNRWADVHLDQQPHQPPQPMQYANPYVHDSGGNRHPNHPNQHPNHHESHNHDHPDRGGKVQGVGLPSIGGTGPQGRVLPAALLGAALLCCHACCSMGLQVARALVAHAGEVAVGGTGVAGLFGHWLAPLALQGLPVGLACVGLGKAIGGVGRHPAMWVAFTTATAVLLAALTAVAGIPLGLAEAAELGSWDSGHWVQAVRAASAGALVVGGGAYVWPAAGASKRARAQTGVVLGVVAVVGCEVVAAGLCFATPYCMN